MAFRDVFLRVWFQNPGILTWGRDDSAGAGQRRRFEKGNNRDNLNSVIAPLLTNRLAPGSGVI
jgi:hypothetical protein